MVGKKLHANHDTVKVKADVAGTEINRNANFFKELNLHGTNSKNGIY